MKNGQHSSETGEWYTPPEWIERVRGTLGGIDLDPCSSKQANGVVRATRYYTAKDDPLVKVNWFASGNPHGRIFINPPGACPKVDGVYSVCGNKSRCGCALPRLFMRRALVEANKGASVVYLAYSVNQLRQLANLKIPGQVRVKVALPPSRIAYLNPETLEPVKGTNCDSAFILFATRYQVATAARFRDEFKAAYCAVMEMQL